MMTKVASLFWARLGVGILSLGWLAGAIVAVVVGSWPIVVVTGLVAIFFGYQTVTIHQNYVLLKAIEEAKD